MPHREKSPTQRRGGLRWTLAAATGIVILVAAPLVVASGSASGATSDWTVYHHDGGGSGVDTSGTPFAPAFPAWSSPALDGQLYGEPLVSDSLVYAATENDTVYALSAASGAVVWSVHLGAPVPSSSLPCGDISPSVGITSTPVIDQARGEIFVVADELVNGTPSHQLFGLNLTSGAVMVQQDVDPPGVSTPVLLQRVALTLDAGRVLFGYGGNFGDCGNFNGWVMGVPETGGPVISFEVDRAYPGQQGAVWMGGGGPVVDAGGNVWVSVGNSNVTSPTAAYDDSESVLELSSSLQLEQFFATPDWYADNANDRDLGSSPPVLLSNGEVLQVGKSHTAYLLSQAHLGGIGGQQASLANFCRGTVDGGSALVGSVAYVPCQSGIMAVQTSASPPALGVQWTSPTGAGGPPIVAGGLIWTISTNGTLFGLNPANGTAVQQFALGAESNHFSTPAVGDGLLLAASSNVVHAFSGAPRVVGMAATPDGHGYWLVAADGGVFAYGDAAFHGSMGGQHLNQPIVGMAVTPDGGGYWLVAADGGIFAFGDAGYAGYAGSMGGQHLNQPIVGIASTPDGRGYWEVAADGGVFSFGDASFRGSTGGQHLNQPVVGIAADHSTGGYWLVASDGGVFAFDAPFLGSTGNLHLNRSVVGFSATPDGGGYRLVASDGGIFAFGDGPFFGSMGGRTLSAPVTGMATVPDDAGYWEVAADGGVFSFGDAPFDGSRA